MKKINLSALLIFSLFWANAQYSVSGIISNKSGKPLAGSSIQLLESNYGAVADAAGSYIIDNVPEGTYIISASFVGYGKQIKTITVDGNIAVDFNLELQSFMSEEVIVSGTRANEKTPVTYSIVNKENLESNNMGQDLPYMLGMEPSLVTTSDAGAGVGYTGLWIRGSNIQRINVTVNGIPLNDPESHGVFWVNMPDFTSSVNSAQVQRGVGTSTNGGGAFGATINLETNTLESKPFAELNSVAGSFNTFKNNVRFGSGLINNKWAFEGRLSKITSDGYVDRAKSELQSYFLQGGYYTENTTLKAVVFSGKEKTYQAWWGVDDWTIDTYGRTFNWAGVRFDEDGSMSFYDNQIDNYQQDHYQLHFSQKLLPELKFNAALHYTYGRGYYEEYYQGENLSDYPIGIQYFGFDSTLNNDGSYTNFYHDTIASADMIVRRWLDNHFYGSIYSLKYSQSNFDLTFGGAFNKYANAKHYGEIIWAQFTGDANIREQFYNNVSDKTDFNSFIKMNYSFGNLSLFGDLQYRFVNYQANGSDKGGGVVLIDKKYRFINPKFGFTYKLNQFGDVYASYAIANREPIRTDFIDAPNGITPEPEKLSDLEVGIRKTGLKKFYNANLFYMKYNNQLVLTGEINDVGAPIRANVGESYRLGLELDGGLQPFGWFGLRANVALSTSNTDYNEEQYDGDGNVSIVKYSDVQVSFSPQAIGGVELVFNPVKNSELGFTTRYVSKQYLDLTENDDKKLDAYTYSNIRFAYSIYPKSLKEIKFTFLVNNLFNQLYASNGYVWGETPYYYPQAGINFLGGVKLRF